ncbi:MAG: Flp pilus assembly protein CpaB [Myxococcota bacterium]|jgi:hypothetical protein|nr:Flp pilus assembly protein CpaB [Myxococcota bacterium]
MRRRWTPIAIALVLFVTGAALSFVVTQTLRGVRGTSGPDVAVVVDPRSDVELEQVVKEGWRAMLVPVDQVSSKGGLLQPNDHVDILGTFLKPEKKGWVTITLLQNVTVLAVGAPLFGKDRGSSETVTLLVTPEEAELLTFSVDKGKISLSARNEDDITNDRALPPRGFRGIFGGKKREYFYRNDALTIELPEPSLIPLFD